MDNRNGYLVTDPNGNGTGAGGRVSLAGPSSPTVTLSTYLVFAPDNGNGTGAGGRVSLAGPSSPTVTLSTYLVLAPDSLGDISEVP